MGYMGRNKNYTGYRAYQYLEPGIDYKVFKFRDAFNKDWAYAVPLSKMEEERSEDLLEKKIVISLHEHPTYMPDNYREAFAVGDEGREFMAYEALSQSGLDAVFDNLLDGCSNVTSKHGWKWTDKIHDIGQRMCDVAHSDFVIHCRKVEDIIKAHETGQLAWVPVIESASCIENEVDRLDVLYGFGIRSMGLVYSESNMLASGHREIRDGGLTDFGYDAVVRMNKLGMLIDVSHGSNQTILDTIEASKAPIILSHNGAQAITPKKDRLNPDNVLEALADKKGLIGVIGVPGSTITKKYPVNNTIDSFMEHIEYCIEIMGINHVGCGPDTLYGDHTGLFRIWFDERLKSEGLGHYTRPGQEKGNEPEILPDYVKGMENPTECLQNVTRWMVKHGYSDQEISKIIGGNALRLLKQVW